MDPDEWKRPKTASPPSKRHKSIDPVSEPKNEHSSKVIIPERLPGEGKMILKSHEVLKLIVQAAEELGLEKSALMLQSESGVLLETSKIATFKHTILSGQWKEVESSLTTLPLRSPFFKDLLQWEIYQHQYLESLEEKRVETALYTLQTKLQPLLASIRAQVEHKPHHIKYETTLKKLSSLLILCSPDALKALVDWPGIKNNAREKLFYSLHKYLISDFLFPNNRLYHLLERSISYEYQNCSCYLAEEGHQAKMLEDHFCLSSSTLILSKPIVLEPNHKDEVWCIAFSNSGKQLASGCKDGSITIWNVEKLNEGVPKVKSTIIGVNRGIQNLCWNKEDSLLLGCTPDFAFLYDVIHGNITRIEPPQNVRRANMIQAVVWAVGELGVICSGLGQYITEYSLDGQKQREWDVVNAMDLAVNHTKQLLVAVCQNKKVNVIDLQKNEVNLECIQEISFITSVSLSANGKFALVHLVSQEIHLWDIESKHLVKQYYHKRNEKSIQCFLPASFGGQDSLILSSSLDGEIYIWARSGALLQKIKGHEKSVNDVKWNNHPNGNKQMLASCGDDNKVLVWPLLNQ